MKSTSSNSRNIPYVVQKKNPKNSKIKIDNVNSPKINQNSTPTINQNSVNSKKFTLNEGKIYSTNHDCFELINKEGKNLSDIKFNFTCFYCRVPRENVHSIGFPIKVELKDTKYTFFIDEPYYCTFNCVYSALSERKCINNDELNSIETNLKLLFSLCHPNETLIRAKDWRLHEYNHGSLTDQEFKDQSLYFTSISTVVLFPAKRLYVQHK